MRKFFKKLAAMIVTYYYNRAYKKAVAFADEQHEKKGEMFYVIDHLVKGQTLTVINRKMFRKMKHDAQDWRNPNWKMYFSKDYNVSLIKDGAWYHTADRSGQNGLSAVEIEARRLFFIRVGLMRAKLLDRVTKEEEEV